MLFSKDSLKIIVTYLLSFVVYFMLAIVFLKKFMFQNQRQRGRSNHIYPSSSSSSSSNNDMYIAGNLNDDPVRNTRKRFKSDLRPDGDSDDQIEESADIINIPLTFFSQFTFTFGMTFVFASVMLLPLALTALHYFHFDTSIYDNDNDGEWWLGRSFFANYWRVLTWGGNIGLWVLLPIAYFYEESGESNNVPMLQSEDKGGNTKVYNTKTHTLNDKESKENERDRERISTNGLEGSRTGNKSVLASLGESFFLWSLFVTLLAISIGIGSRWLGWQGTLSLTNAIRFFLLSMFTVVSLVRAICLPRGIMACFGSTKKGWAVSLAHLRSVRQRLENVEWEEQSLEAKIEREMLENMNESNRDKEEENESVLSDESEDDRDGSLKKRKRIASHSSSRSHQQFPIGIRERQLSDPVAMNSNGSTLSFLPNSRTVNSSSTNNRFSRLHQMLSKLTGEKEKLRRILSQNRAPLRSNLVFMILLALQMALVLLLLAHISLALIQRLRLVLESTIISRLLLEPLVRNVLSPIVLVNPVGSTLVLIENVTALLYHHLSLFLGLHNLIDNKIRNGNDDDGKVWSCSRKFGWMMLVLFVANNVNWVVLESMSLQRNPMDEGYTRTTLATGSMQESIFTTMLSAILSSNGSSDNGSSSNVGGGGGGGGSLIFSSMVQVPSGLNLLMSSFLLVSLLYHCLYSMQSYILALIQDLM